MEQLPEENIVLLRHLVFMLHHISQNAQENKMNSNNLAVCVAPNLLQSDQVEKTKKVSQFLPFTCLFLLLLVVVVQVKKERSILTRRGSSSLK